MVKYLYCLLFINSVIFNCGAQHSEARIWNEVVLESIRNDFARPTIHARNLFHISAAMYDAWAIYDDNISTYYTGKQLGNSICPIENFEKPDDIESARIETISFATYKLLKHRFKNAPGYYEILALMGETMAEFNLDVSVNSMDYQNDGPAALGNYIAECYIEYGLQDGANELFSYDNQFYKTLNGPLNPDHPGNPNLVFVNNWQPLQLDLRIDQSGNIISENITLSLSPEWGYVLPFSLNDNDLDLYNRSGNLFKVYFDPGPPPLLNNITGDEYRWGFEMVSIWSAHLSSDNETMWDISPGSIGNIDEFPADLNNYSNFYNFYEGGDSGKGHELNPVTGLPYEPNLVKRGDFARVVAEFWADGPDSETPPGHWFTILNDVNDNPLSTNKFKGTGDSIPQLEWDIKAYFLMGAAMHDAAVAGWSIKGYYDYIRPISAIRFLADLGQRTDTGKPNYNINGIDLIDGFIEQVNTDDPIYLEDPANLNKIKLYCWRGPAYINDEETDEAGVGWILAENWWPYQRPSFVTPPFAGYVSGHSTFSAAAAKVLELLTGSAFFPGGIGEYDIKKNQFLVFEDGPSQDFKLQWGTYKDAANQSALSRIWGGIHPPCDDIPGRKIGEKIGLQSFSKAEQYFNGQIDPGNLNFADHFNLYPNPVASTLYYSIPGNFTEKDIEVSILNINGKLIRSYSNNFITSNGSIPVSDLQKGTYLIRFKSENSEVIEKFVLIK